MKLSPRQKEVIEHMRKGNLMYKNVTYVTLQYNHCSVATFWALVKKGLLKKTGRYYIGTGVEHVLTELGNSIIL